MTISGTLTVQELIQELEKLDPEAAVLIKSNQTWALPISSERIRQSKVPKDFQKDGKPEHQVIIQNR